MACTLQLHLELVLVQETDYVSSWNCITYLNAGKVELEMLGFANEQTLHVFPQSYNPSRNREVDNRAPIVHSKSGKPLSMLAGSNVHNI